MADVNDGTADDIAAVADALASAEGVVALTGAGVSTASGIPSFRGADGIWGTEFDPKEFHYSRFRRDPEGFWTARVRLQERMLPDDVAPNAAHHALCDLEELGVLDAVLTQNTDGLHREAGQGTLVELHGTAREVVCHDRGRRTAAAPVFDRARDGERPPRCTCGGVFKPDVVLFGEDLDRERMARAEDLAVSSDIVLAVGTSLQVNPAASLAGLGERLVLVNFEETPYSSRAWYDLRSDVTTVLPRLVELVEARV